QSDIYRSGYSIFGAPKPWFSVENDALRYHAPESLEPRVPGVLSAGAYALRGGRAYSAVARYLLARLAPGYWGRAGSQVRYRKADIDEADVTCRLLKRVKAQADQDGIRTLLFMQYYAGIILEADKPPRDAQRVMACAQQMDIRVLDQFASLRRLLA